MVTESEKEKIVSIGAILIVISCIVFFFMELGPWRVWFHNYILYLIILGGSGLIILILGNALPIPKSRPLHTIQSKPVSTLPNFCSNCGSKFDANVNFCPYCGYPIKQL